MTKQLLAVTVAMALASSCAHGQKPLNVLYLSKSTGYEHSVVKRHGDKLSHSEQILTEIVQKMGGTILCTKDAGLINAENLKKYNVVIFCTTGYLTELGTDGQPVMGPNGVTDLLEWIKAGNGFIGYHNANDSFHSKENEISPYVEMIGGEFETHGKQFNGTLKVVSKGHPAIASLQDGWSHQDEWYISKNLNKEKMHVLALLDPSSVYGDKEYEVYQRPCYPIIWCLAYGNGRVLYNALGHREDMWSNPDFQQLLRDNLSWANGNGELNADPNYDTVVPKAIEEPKK
ncbi:MAG TPA: ThuA domain-containing protein [Candidatus Hydrogenedentes bacterium]|nr:ThuA domain-containing protein [Candidatus Hydrogenedentota bacterium]